MGHLFVAQGDLTRLACDAIVVPCDSRLNVNTAWQPILPRGLPVGDRGDWIRLDGTEDARGVVSQPDSGGRLVRAFVAVHFETTPRDIVERLWKALVVVAERLAPAHGRVEPLIGIPLVGTGYGGLEGRRGEVIEQLLTRHRRESLRADLALILLERRDFAAVQVQRNPTTDWAQLDESLQGIADDLGHLAGEKQLSLFLGSGVSRPAGLPDWEQLLEGLARDVPMKFPSGDGLEEAASEIKLRLGDRYPFELRKRLSSHQHAVGHALLAGLRVDQMVTTNFDLCTELALEPLLGGDFRVLARQAANGGMPWLLKLNGDIVHPESLTLTSEEFENHKVESEALRGVVQSLMLTSHLLFVGFSFRDKSFLELAAAVNRVREASSGAGSPIGTALALTEKEADSIHIPGMVLLPMSKERPDEAARTLEIFLDRLAWAASTNRERSAEYLLDPRYWSGLSDADRELWSLLRTLELANDEVRSSAGWSRVAACLRELGSDYH